MTRGMTTVDISAMPDLVDLVGRVRSTGRPVLLTSDGEDVAVLMPPPHDAASARRSRSGRTNGSTIGAVAATAGMLRGETPARSPADEREAFTRAVAEQVVESLRD